MILVILLFWSFLGILLIKFIQPSYEVKTSILVEEPQRMYDPYRYTLGPQVFNPPDDEYFVNEKIRIRSTPLIEKTIDSLNFDVTYLKNGFGKRVIYENRPFEVILGDKWKDKNSDLAFNQAINIHIKDENNFILSGELKSSKSKTPISINESHQFGQNIKLGGGSFKILRKTNEIGSFLFKIHDKNWSTIDALDRIDVETVELNATVMSIAIKGPIPQKQIDFLNTLSGFYLQQHIDEKKKVYLQVDKFIDAELASLKATLDHQEQIYSDFKLKNNINNLSKKAGIILNQTTKLENEASNLKVKQKYHEYLNSFLENSSNYEKLISPLAFKINDPVLIELTSELVQLQMEKNHLIVEGNEENPSYAFISSKIDAIKKSVLESVEAFKASNQIRLDDIEERLSNLNEDSKSIPDAEREFIEIDRDLNMAEIAYVNMLEKKSNSEIALGSVVSDFKIIEPAHVIDDEPFFPNTLLIFVLVILLSVLSWVAYLVYKFAYKSELDNLQDLYPILEEIDLDGVINFSNIKNANTLKEYPNSFTYESFKSLMLKTSNNLSSDGKVVLVSSQKVNEGKSFIASGLANSFADTGRKVLFIDINSHSTKHKNRLGMLNPSADEITDTFHENLSYLKGESFRKTISTSRQNALAELNKLKKQYDIIVIDTPTLTLCAEVQELMKMSDRNLLVLRRNYSSTSEFIDTKLSLHSGFEKNTGIVFNSDIDKYSQLSRKAKKYYKNKRSSIFHLLRLELSKI